MSDPLERLRMPVVPIEPREEFAEGLLRRIRGTERPAGRDTATIRYFVNDLDAAVSFYRDLLGFDVELRPSPVFAMLYRGELRLLLTVPGEPHVLPDGTLPEPGGHNRISLLVDDLQATVAALREEGARVRGEIATGVAVDTVLLQDPAGNPVELIAPRGSYHERASRDTQQRHPDDASTTTEEEPQ
ncbi:MAG TPA: VOC family protein [Solirubrobacteraceae bacterium]|nr:VOC family protein [Solirubrobacteraceae bacterium]